MVNLDDIIPGEAPGQIKRRMGMKFGKATLIRYVGYVPGVVKTTGLKKRTQYIEVACDCGKKAIKRFAVRMPRSCGCAIPIGGNEFVKNLVGKTINGRKVIGLHKSSNCLRIKVKCKCGKIVVIPRERIFNSKCQYCSKETKIPRKDQQEIFELYKSKIYNREQLCKMFNVNYMYLNRLLTRLNRKAKYGKS